ncbi:MAG: alpha/beta hydrolase [Acidimicrobiales bacterium]
MIVHGGMDRAAGFRRTIRHLPDREVVAYDRRGYAGSRLVPLGASMLDQVDDLVAVCATLDRPLVVGHSLGGLIALLLLTRPDAADLVVGAVDWEGPLAWNEWYVQRSGRLDGRPPEEVAEFFMRMVIGDRLWERLPAATQAERRAEGAALVADTTQSRSPEAAVDFGAIHLPVLVGCGTTSAEQHQRSAHEAAAAIEGARLVVIEGADHGVHLSSPTAFADLIRSWG